jgi:hypothetical protein
MFELAWKSDPNDGAVTVSSLGIYRPNVPSQAQDAIRVARRASSRNETGELFPEVPSFTKRSPK